MREDSACLKVRSSVAPMFVLYIYIHIFIYIHTHNVYTVYTYVYTVNIYIYIYILAKRYYLCMRNICVCVYAYVNKLHAYITCDTRNTDIQSRIELFYIAATRVYANRSTSFTAGLWSNSPPPLPECAYYTEFPRTRLSAWRHTRVFPLLPLPPRHYRDTSRYLIFGGRI